MSDTFVVFEPKRYFKRDREFHVFLFNSNLILCKKEELPTRKVKYIYKNHIMVRESNQRLFLSSIDEIRPLSLD